MFSIQESHSPRFARQVDPSPPETSETLQDTLQIVLLGDEVSFDCSVESEDVSEVSIWWQKDGINLTSVEDKYRMEVSKTAEGVVSSQLIVSDIEWEDAGVYNCRARDGSEGRIEKNKATISVQGIKEELCKNITIFKELNTIEGMASLSKQELLSSS